MVTQNSGNLKGRPVVLGSVTVALELDMSGNAVGCHDVGQLKALAGRSTSILSLQRVHPFKIHHVKCNHQGGGCDRNHVEGWPRSTIIMGGNRGESY
jgi:hypothetical protein